MLDKAQTKPGSANIAWRQADAMKLPFPDGSFDLAVCQFGVMFLPSRSASGAAVDVSPASCRGGLSETARPPRASG